jgi:hypothetical protein
MQSASARAVADVLHDVIAAKGPKQRGVRVHATPPDEEDSSRETEG